MSLDVVFYKIKRPGYVLIEAWYGEVGGVPLWAHAEAFLPPLRYQPQGREGGGIVEE